MVKWLEDLISLSVLLLVPFYTSCVLCLYLALSKYLCIKRQKMCLVGFFCSIYDGMPKIASLLYFLLQLAICIEWRRELNEDYQDCIESMDHTSPHKKVTMMSLLFQCFTVYSVFFFVFGMKCLLAWLYAGRWSSWGGLRLICYANTGWRFWWETWQVN